MSVMASSEVQSADTYGAGKSSWEYAVPINQENHPPMRTRRSNDDNIKAARAPLSSTNGTSLNRKTSRDVVEGPARSGSYDNAPPLRRLGELSRQESSISKRASEPDSLLDLYGQPSGRSNSKVDSGERGETGINTIEDQSPEGKWIHRDKLAKIESEELQAAGISLPTAKGPMGNANSKRSQSRDAARDRSRGMEGDSVRDRSESKRKRASSTISNKYDQERTNWDLRTPEEIAADPMGGRETSDFYSIPAGKKSASKIPVFANSPVPLSTSHVERTTPLARKRNVSGSGDEEGLQFGIARSRANSIGSQVLLDEFEPANDSPTPAASRPASKTGLNVSPSKKSSGQTPTSPTAASQPGTRKVSTSTSARKTSSGQQPRSTSNNASPANRPGTRSADDRPKTAVNRPEGDPPWLATMYKPDPRLPPDQQIIPTHARKQQQAQWQEEGAVPTTYDRNFSPLAIHTADGLKPSSPPGQSGFLDKETSAIGGNGDAWPLRSLATPPTTNGRPGTSGTDHGGYSTMPNLKKSPVIGTGGVAQSPNLGAASQVKRIQQPPPPDELPKGKEKSCGCCIVM